MKIIINNSSMQPIYEQIVVQVKQMVVDGLLKEETALPSVRALARELSISALTVKKAYDALEQEGFVNTIHGKGSYIAHTGKNLLQEERRKETEEKMEEVILLAKNGNMSKKDVTDLFEIILEEVFSC